MNRGNGRPSQTAVGRAPDNRSRIEYAKRAIEEMAEYAVDTGQNGTIGIEISVKDGKLGKVKRLHIDFQPE
jgi:uncharacterized protein YbjQ (UPF0145 family)